MALTWNIEDVAPSEHVAYLGENDPETRQYSGHESWPVEWKREAASTQACVFATIAIGIGKWTAENIDEVAWRMEFYQKVDGPLLANEDGAYPVTEEHVRALVGLQTNVGYEPRNKWLARLWGKSAV